MSQMFGTLHNESLESTWLNMLYDMDMLVMCHIAEFFTVGLHQRGYADNIIYRICVHGHRRWFK